jgi:hypothetical protein
MVTTVGLTFLITHGGSAGFGFSWVGECRELVAPPVRVQPAAAD